MSRAIKEFLKDEERAFRILVDASAAVVAVAMIIGVGAIILMR
ncbi:hypothetical protein [Lacisediminimonas sp.]|nr:hypothetical protein [Lacisediminimonas sp.]MDO8298955.1 hypothetical protein [Lacisediminimonas sp.]MDO9218991.1 hypothetical protein [Lacisediminimonas sp.]